MTSRRPTVPSRPSRPTAAASPTGSSVLVVTADAVLDRHLLSVVAAVGLPADEATTEEDLRRGWRVAGAVLVGTDRAAEVHALALPPRPDVYVVGRDEERVDALAWSTRLRAAVATLPDGAPDLADALADLDGGRASAGLVAVTGGSGGVGASTLAAALALAAARQGLRTFLLDADVSGGGLDVLLGAEDLAGWRWSRFAGSRGHLGDLGGQLPQCDGVDVLAVDPACVPAGLRPEQVGAVLDSCTRSHDLVVVDLPRHRSTAHEEVVRSAARVLLVVRSDVRGVAAADAAARSLLPDSRLLQVVVRTGRGHGLAPDLVADALGLPLAGVLEDDVSVPAAAERGEPPGLPARSPLGRLCGRLLDLRLETAA